MTKSTAIMNASLNANTDDLPQPEVAISTVASATTVVTGLPRPTGCAAGVADSGRITFGGAFRLPTNN